MGNYKKNVSSVSSTVVKKINQLTKISCSTSGRNQRGKSTPIGFPSSQRYLHSSAQNTAIKNAWKSG